MTASVPRLHAITNDAVLALPDFEERARAVISAGPVLLHLRSASWPAGRRATLARRLVELGGSVAMNDRADLVAWVRAAGLHLPDAGLPTAVGRRLVGPGILLGRSTHAAAAAGRALAEGADYAFLGPIWETASHPGAPGLGLEALAACGPGPVIAIGGVTAERAPACRDAGAHGVAAVGALWFADDPRSAARALLLSFESD